MSFPKKKLIWQQEKQTFQDVFPLKNIVIFAASYVSLLVWRMPMFHSPAPTGNPDSPSTGSTGSWLNQLHWKPSSLLCLERQKKTCFLARYFKMYTNRQHKSIQLIYSEHLRKKNTIFKFQSTCLKNLDTNWCILKPCNKKSARMILNVATMLFHAWSSWGASKDVPEEVKLGICYRPKRSMYSHFT